MATIIRETSLDTTLAAAWDALRDFPAVHERLARGFVLDAQMVEAGTRQLTFSDGAVVREVLLGIDEASHRVAYSVVSGPLGATHHHASARVLPADHGGVRFRWVTDVLPDEVAPLVADLMDHGIEAIRRTLELQPPYQHSAQAASPDPGRRRTHRHAHG